MAQAEAVDTGTGTLEHKRLKAMEKPVRAQWAEWKEWLAG